MQQGMLLQGQARRVEEVSMKIFNEETVVKLRELPPRKREELLDALAKMLAARAEKPYERPPDSH